jgi:acyl-coenzyme A thioesterase PaaI-like protein
MTADALRAMTSDGVVSTERLQAATPFARTLGIEVLAVDERHAVLRLPARDDLANHVGGPHAGAIFTLGEAAAAVLMLQRFGGWMDRAVPLAIGATIQWSKLARSSVTADATADGVADRVRAELEAGERPEWETTVVFRREQDGEECARMTVLLTLKPLAPNP